MNKSKIFKSAAFRKGTYSIILTIIIVAVLVGINIFVRQLPASATEFDMSEDKLFTLGDTTKEVASSLTQDVVLTVTANEDDVDARIVSLLKQYEALSSHITVKYVDPELYPSVLTDLETSAGYIVAQCEALNKINYISLNDILYYDSSYNYYFDGEGSITSAINSVVTDTIKYIYALSGHGESAVGTAVTAALNKSNLMYQDSFTLLTSDIPEDCDILICNGPTSDITEDEASTIADYIDNGGNFIVLFNYEAKSTPNLDALCNKYGIGVNHAIIGDQKNYAGRSYYAFIPEYNSSSDITGGYSTSDGNQLVLLQTTIGFETLENSDVTVDEFLTTSSNGFEYVEGSSDVTLGTYAVAARSALSSDNGGSVTAYGTYYMIDDAIVGHYSVINTEIFVNSIIVDFDDISNISIDPIAISANYNYIASSGLIAVFLIGIIPVLLIVIGIFRWNYRRKL